MGEWEGGRKGETWKKIMVVRFKLVAKTVLRARNSIIMLTFRFIYCI